jgi:hypothetical protein
MSVKTSRQNTKSNRSGNDEISPLQFRLPFTHGQKTISKAGQISSLSPKSGKSETGKMPVLNSSALLNTRVQ